VAFCFAVLLSARKDTAVDTIVPTAGFYLHSSIAGYNQDK
jgi:hypothetical protein